MLPTRTREGLRVVRAFEIITPDGRIYGFPQPTALQRLLGFLRSYADVAALSAAIIMLIYVAALAAESLEMLQLEACASQTGRQKVLFSEG